MNRYFLNKNDLLEDVLYMRDNSTPVKCWVARFTKNGYEYEFIQPAEFGLKKNLVNLLLEKSLPSDWKIGAVLTKLETHEYITVKDESMFGSDITIPIEGTTFLQGAGYVKTSSVNKYKKCDLCGDFYKSTSTNGDNVLFDIESNTEIRKHVCRKCVNTILRTDYVQEFDTGIFYPKSLVGSMIYNYSGTTVYILEKNKGNYIVCEDCGDLIYYENVTVYNGRSLCSSCYESATNFIKNYSYKPNPVFFSEAGETTKRFYGLELEVDNGDDAHELAKNLDVFSDRIYCKHDGSLGSDGLEIVTHPATIDYHKSEFGWDKITDICADMGYRNNCNSAGLHIHVSRDGLGSTVDEQELVIAKILLIFDRFFDDEILKFSRRKMQHLTEWAGKPDANIQKNDAECVLRQKVRDVRGWGRYKSVNLQNEYTVEFRLFRSTTRPDRIYNALEFVDCVINWAQAHTVEETMDVSFKDLIHSYASEELDKYCTERQCY